MPISDHLFGPFRCNPIRDKQLLRRADGMPVTHRFPPYGTHKPTGIGFWIEPRETPTIGPDLIAQVAFHVEAGRTDALRLSPDEIEDLGRTAFRAL
ncbi:hypothetical protein HCU64_14505 [Methylobacterium sp. C25]|uniref:hypothetical protein n=1 Tax=Methylobacterium sp. C25 TaxID=2721622 RepID=UPI001F2878F4|nr:hypothetical protein [Methylobacterium sp. C25]MCE4224971.1 hypothetical protein [Methylobacterium sp. C25]